MAPLSLVFQLLVLVFFVRANAYNHQRQNDTNAGLAYSPPYYPSPWMDPEAKGWETAYAQAKAVVEDMTLLEKVNLTTGVGWMGDLCVGNVGSIPRLGWRGLCMQDGPQGIRFADYVSYFTSSQVAAASFDRGLLYRRGNAMAAEAKGKGVDVLLGPSIGPLGRLPAAGRNWEGFGTDPYLAGVAAAETVKGIQDAGVVANVKHFIVNEQEHFRQAGEARGYGFDIAESLSSNVDDRTMHEVYLWPFADTIRAGAGSIMCSYQQINNSYGCQNSYLLNGILKQEMGFQGFVLSDWQAQHAGAATAVAGLDMTMPGDTVFNSGVSFWGANLTNAVLNGTVPEHRLDDMAMRILAAWFKVGNSLDEVEEVNFSSWTRDTVGPVHFAANEDVRVINQHIDVRENHGDMIRSDAARGTVLLKNEGALPLDKPKFVAVVGEDAGPRSVGPNGCADQGCNDGTLAAGWGSGTASFPYLVTPDSALQKRALEDGSRYESILSNWADDATVKLVSEPDATPIVFVNANSGEGYMVVDGNRGDRNNLTLWNGGDELIKRVAGVNPNTIVVVHSTGPVLVTDWYQNPNVTAIVWAGLPGQESGNAITDILYGRVNPGGKTPFTWGPTEESYGVKVLTEPNNGNGAPQDDFTEGVLVDYRWFDKQTEDDDMGVTHADGNEKAPVFEFGFGLSYTSFEFSDLRVEKKDPRPYKPTAGETAPAPRFGGNYSQDYEDYVFPSDEFSYVYQHIYPYLNSSDPVEALADPDYGLTAEEFLPPGALDGSAQPKLPASGPNGGNAQLWDTMYTVFATITNTGDVVGDEVAQLYVSLGGPDDAPKVLRGFERIRIDPGTSETFRADLTRRDLSNWDVVTQNWVVSDYPKTIYVGNSSRKLPLSTRLE
ncbi:beta-glucosidase [Sodiomyces alkalinus F11]|uniref:beta-glucosidase n=1 Tax=Sodiomyces alkalinus (strain CBS 110278 / VKM F-3762 / F11) TaxID=1314773 RepID=A0A3N2PP18_SODAK|nr:beta-glucosidase [Sodiomyces alkalinus F11]ROT36180.1 beta-glucosidase [Sodiomyces alkalinus F11]